MGNLTVAKQIELAEREMKGKTGIQFYCSKRHQFIFIPNVSDQNFKHDCAKKK